MIDGSGSRRRIVEVRFASTAALCSTEEVRRVTVRDIGGSSVCIVGVVVIVAIVMISAVVRVSVALTVHCIECSVVTIVRVVRCIVCVSLLT